MYGKMRYIGFIFFFKAASMHAIEVSGYAQRISEAESATSRGSRKKSGKVKKGRRSDRVYEECSLEFMKTWEVRVKCMPGSQQ